MQQFNGLSHQEFYTNLTASQERFTTPEAQEKKRDSVVLVAGAGSIGGPIGLLLARQGYEHIIIADPDVVDYSNLGRQPYFIDQVGTNKGIALAQNCSRVNPFASYTVVEEGITYHNAHDLVNAADIIVDGIDISAMGVMYNMHTEASMQGRPVLTAFDMAGTALIDITRYDRQQMQPLRGTLSDTVLQNYQTLMDAVSQKRASNTDMMKFILSALVGPIDPLKIPQEQLLEYLSRQGGERTPQLGTTSTLVSALAVDAIGRIVNNEPTKNIISADIPSLVRLNNPSKIKTLILLLKALRKSNMEKYEVEQIIYNLKMQ